MTNDNLAACGAVAGCEHFFPCSRVWPIGLSWFSCAAQETLLSLCRDSGLTSDFVLAPDAPIPDSCALAFGVATDDLMVFSEDGPGATLSSASRMEATMLRNGVVKNADKDINDACTTTCVDIDLVEGVRGFHLEGAFGLSSTPSPTWLVVGLPRQAALRLIWVLLSGTTCVGNYGCPFSPYCTISRQAPKHAIGTRSTFRTAC